MWKFAFMFFFSMSLLLGGGILEVEAACNSSAVNGAITSADGDLGRCRTAIRDKNWTNYDTYMKAAKRYYNDAVRYNNSHHQCDAEVESLKRRLAVTSASAFKAKGLSIKPKPKYKLPPEIGRASCRERV